MLYFIFMKKPDSRGNNRIQWYSLKIWSHSKNDF